MRKKGIAGLAIAVIGAIVIVGIIASIVIPIVFLKIHLAKIVEIEYNYNNAGLTMLALLADDDIYRDLSLYVAGYPDKTSESFSRSGVESAVTERLYELVPSNCFKLSYEGGTVVDMSEVDSACNSMYYTAEAYISSPIDSMKQKITLSIKSESGVSG